jgi:hypothetical protein
MGNRRIGWRRVRAQLTYTVAEAARATATHRNTIRHWLKSGLEAVDCRQPTLIKGATLKDFIQAKRAGRRQPCGPGRIFCLKCREPKRPAFGEVEYESDNGKLGRLVGLCPDCGTIILRRTSARKVHHAAGDLVILFRRGVEHLNERGDPSPNCDCKRG